MFKTQIQELLKKILEEQGITDVEPVVEQPADLSHGDYTTNIAMQIKNKSEKIKNTNENVKILAQKNPREIAEYIKTQMETGNRKLENLDHIEVAGPGFINFWVAKEELINNLSGVLSSDDKVIKSGKLDSRKFIVEFAHPNTHKALHIGHLRNISTGESIVRLLESQGAKVIRANYQGDVGMHIAKAMYGLLDLSAFKEELKSVTGVQERVNFLGKAYAAGSQAYENDPTAKEKIHDYNYLVYACAQRFQEEKGIPAGTTDYLKFVHGRKEDIDLVYQVWKETRQWSLDYYEMMYKFLNARFDRYYFESECLQGVDKAREAVKKGVLTESEGAIVFPGEQYGLDTRVFVNSLGLPTYEAKELALAEKEFSEFGKVDKLIHVVGPEQSSFFQVTFKVEELLGMQKNQQYHLAYGWVRLKQGKMSSRLGNVITAEQLVNEVKKAITEIIAKPRMNYPSSDSEKFEINNSSLPIRSGSNNKDSVVLDENIGEQIAVAAIKYSFLKVSTGQEIAFDLQESVSAEGNSGPYLQYTYARTQSVIRKAEDRHSGDPRSGSIESHMNDGRDPIGRPVKRDSLQGDSNWGVTLAPEEDLLLRLLYQFDEIVAGAAEKYSPNILCNYLFTLAQQFNLFYQKHPILDPGRHPEPQQRHPGDPSADGSIGSQGEQAGDSIAPPTVGLQNDSTFEDIKNFRLALTTAVGKTIKDGLYLLGIEAPIRM